MRGMVLLYAVAALLRLWLMNSATLATAISSRVEVSTPLNSWLRVKEGVYLQSQGVAVYSGGVFHESPITLFLGGIFIRSWGWWVQVVFITCDLLTAFLLSRAAMAYANKLLGEQHTEAPRYAPDSRPLLLSAASLAGATKDVAAAYLLCPYTVLSCTALTTTTLHNLVLASLLLAMLKGRAVLFGALVALATYQAVYPVVLLVPGLIALYQYHADPYHHNCASAPPLPDSSKEVRSGALRPALQDHCVRILCRSLVSFVVTAALLLLVSAEIAGGWDFLEATYGFILSAPDLTPNIGLFWYFFTEMFEHFRLFFLAVFQLNAVIFQSIYPCHAPTHVTHPPMSRTYPCHAPFHVTHPPMSRTYPFLRQSFLVGCMLVASSVLGPIMYNQWIFSGAANANFYFAVTLAFNTAQIFLVTDLLFGHVKRQHLLYNGSSMTIEGKPARLTLE
ncbi:phosphatidylinositol glycan anchor biosynthesis class U protein [Hyalella azteca]|uniref:Phosphatidylinositol glycan anchor biosynthesis class U protein n=1 Tax=Hyalella azteca TaxID=294128 RepID=A0A8B7PKY1_HYAAZ|nr:phosphatidylinositol glycan anchor biosynthesis class U protein [Hyalella azteca]